MIVRCRFNARCTITLVIRTMLLELLITITTSNFGYCGHFQTWLPIVINTSSYEYRSSMNRSGFGLEIDPIINKSGYK